MALTQYCDESDIVAAYGSVFWLNVADDDDDGTADGVAPALLWASARINGYVGSKYALPLVDVPDDLKQMAVDLTIYRRATTADRMTDDIKERKEDAIQYLKDVRDGEISLGLENPPASNVGGFNLYGPVRAITKEEWDLL